MPRPEDIQTMFTAIAGRYDRLNHVLSFGLDAIWWRAMARESLAAPGRRFLDVAAGTGDSSLALARRGAEVISTDFTFAMLRLGPEKFRQMRQDQLVWASVGADAMRLPFRDSQFDGVTICYGIRNVADRGAAFREFHRVLRPGGQLTVLEFSRPRWAWLRWTYGIYSRHVLPRIGRWLSGDLHAYSYLPESIQQFPDQPALVREIEGAGFCQASWRNLSGGIAALHLATKP